jgi:hypothetical protein
MNAQVSNIGGYHANQNEQPPVIDFFMGAKEDRAASLEAKRVVMADVVMVRIRQRGSKDFVEKEAEDFVSEMESYSMSGRVPPDWGYKYREAFDRYKKGEEGPVEGVDVRNWPGATPAQQQNLRSMGILSVQDVARMNEAAMKTIGMGAVMLKQRAEAFLSTLAGKVNSEQVAQQNATIDAQGKQIEELRAQIAALSDKRKKD